MGYSAWFFNHSAPLLYHNRKGMSSATLYRKGAAQLQVMVQKTLFCLIEFPRLYKIFILYNYSKFKSKMQAPVLNNIKIAKDTTSVPFAIIFFEYEFFATD